MVYSYISMMLSLDVSYMLYPLVSLAVAYVLYLLVTTVMRRNRYNLPPGRSEPLTNGLHLRAWDHKEKYGHVSRLKILGFDLYCLNTIEAQRQFMLAPELMNHTAGREDSSLTQFFMSDGIIMCADSDKFRKLRALVFTTFKPYASKAIEQVVIGELSMLKEELRKVEGQSIDIQDYIGPSLANIMFIMMIGKRFDYDHKIQRSMARMIKEFGNMTDIKPFVYLNVFPFLRYLPFGYGAICKSWSKAMNDIMKYVLYDIRAEGRDAWEKGEGFVYDLLKQQEQHDWLTDSEVHGVIRDMFLAGIMTTKSALYSLFLFMIHLPDIQTKLHKELDDEGDDPCLDYLDRMPYTQATILETLRLASVLPLGVDRVVTSDIKLYGYDIPKGAIVHQNQWKVHHDDTLWTDPWKFVPERFIDQQDGTLLLIDDPVRKNLVPFGLGKRKCIGDNFARTRMFLFVSHLCQTFRFYSDDPDNMPSMDPSTFDPSPLNRPYPYKLKVEVRC